MNWKKALPDAASEDWAYATEIKGNIKLTPVKVNKIVEPLNSIITIEKLHVKIVHKSIFY